MKKHHFWLVIAGMLFGVAVMEITAFRLSIGPEAVIFLTGFIVGILIVASSACLLAAGWFWFADWMQKEHSGDDDDAGIPGNSGNTEVQEKVESPNFPQLEKTDQPTAKVYPFKR